LGGVGSGTVGALLHNEVTKGVEKGEGGLKCNNINSSPKSRKLSISKKSSDRQSSYLKTFSVGLLGAAGGFLLALVILLRAKK
jgi:hypothetical protein